MEWLLYLSVAIIAVAFAALVFYLIKTLISMKQTLDNVSSTVEGLQQQVDGITKESQELIHKTNLLADDIQRKSDSLNSVFAAANDLGETVQNVNHSLKTVSAAISKKANEQSDQVAQAVKWGNVALDFWGKWKAKKADIDTKETKVK
ncbi:DUF948 domain-containing protein [Evansella sp. LMS18]|uniref:DUF948 domain-containing protein n=1 Tax=Evansella sp. LMS18 TaxID=2924033 RepID=UPI0020D14876|nr:DUF948 domain-containing protein [Evansella sp. LMS18]UTR11420.1 DUF948 domain-containing protein [Evansella sp. LMS18]